MTITEVLREMHETAKEIADAGIPGYGNRCASWADATEAAMREKEAEIEQLRKENERLRNALHRISLASQNSASTKADCGWVASTALAATEMQK